MNGPAAENKREMTRTVDRLQIIMVVLWLAALGVWVVRQEWRAASILTLTVAAAIVQLRWLAAQVTDIVSLTLASAEEPSPEAATDASGSLSRTEDTPTENGLESKGHEHSRSGSQADSRGRIAERQVGEDEADPGLARDVSVPRLFTIVTLRPALLLLGACGLFYVGSTEPLALAAGVLTLPMALMTEAVLSAVRASRVG